MDDLVSHDDLSKNNQPFRIACLFEAFRHPSVPSSLFTFFNENTRNLTVDGIKTLAAKEPHLIRLTFFGFLSGSKALMSSVVALARVAVPCRIMSDSPAFAATRLFV